MRRQILSLSFLALAAFAAVIATSAPASADHRRFVPACGSHVRGAATLSERQVVRIMHRHGYRNIRRVDCRGGWWLVSGRGRIAGQGRYVHGRYVRFVDPVSGRVFRHPPRFAYRGF